MLQQKLHEEHLKKREQVFFLFFSFFVFFFFLNDVAPIDEIAELIRLLLMSGIGRARN